MSQARRQARQRRDYLHRRALTLRESAIAERRARLKAALASGKPLPGDIVNDRQLRKDFAFDETADELQSRLLDDEYQTLSGVQDPRVLITTSRSPSSKLQTFSKEIRLLLPTGTCVNRGTMTLQDLVRAANATGLTDIVHVHEHRGNPTALTISHLPHGPTISFSLHNVKFRHDLPHALRGNVPESYPHLIFDGFSTELGKRVQRILQHLFPPRDANMRAASRTVTFKRLEDDSIEVRHHVFVRTGYDQLELSEVGPRMTMRVFQIMNCTLDNREGDVEWRLKHYTRTARKKTVL
ncbi:U3 small nucleolar ribonucleoprotein imp4 [Tolypocladium capitatum]|uniref:U3 small nucleolar ribonucleoprotein protein IMP4 n=1 Tax=Tolypocladium capitatum TaxID=45235 RepID=A0A2K3QJR0_9HYPO|nr:U3 small nucleolar ribonucleoprotein imp4 [Tolypocladium capitatum]